MASILCLCKLKLLVNAKKNLTVSLRNGSLTVVPSGKWLDSKLAGAKARLSLSALDTVPW